MQKRKKSVAVLLVLALLILAMPMQVFGLEFSDVPITASYYKAVDKLSNIGIIQGRGDGAFAPVDKTTRAEFCAFLARANGYDAKTYQVKEMPFSDVAKDHWATGYISFCYENGYINGMPDGTFCPNNYVTDEQAVKMIVCASGVGDESLSAVGPNWYSGYLTVAQKYNLLSGTSVQVSNSASRAFVAQVVYNAMMVDGVLENPQAEETDTTGTETPAPQEGKLPNAVETEDGRLPNQVADSVLDEVEEEENKADSKTENKKDENKKEEKEEEKKPTITVPKDQQGKLIVVLDPGHNYSVTDTGAVGCGLREQDITFAIASKVKPLLEANGFYVVMTRNKLTDNVSEESVVESLKRRAEIANEIDADLFLSIHCNAGGGSGVETYYFEDSVDGEFLAECIQEQVADAMDLEDRGIKSASFAVLRYTGMTAALLETAFIDNEDDAAILGSKTQQQAYAVAICKGICDYFGIK